MRYGAKILSADSEAPGHSDDHGAFTPYWSRVLRTWLRGCDNQHAAGNGDIAGAVDMLQRKDPGAQYISIDAGSTVCLGA